MRDLSWWLPALLWLGYTSTGAAVTSGLGGILESQAQNIGRKREVGFEGPIDWKCSFGGPHWTLYGAFLEWWKASE
jgi:hypothetical protein